MRLELLFSIVAVVLGLSAVFGYRIDITNGFAAKVPVEIYKNQEDGEMTYCESGTLVDPPFTYMGSGTIDGDKASAC